MLPHENNLGQGGSCSWPNATCNGPLFFTSGLCMREQPVCHSFRSPRPESTQGRPLPWCLKRSYYFLALHHFLHSHFFDSSLWVRRYTDIKISLKKLGEMLLQDRKASHTASTWLPEWSHKAAKKERKQPFPQCRLVWLSDLHLLPWHILCERNEWEAESGDGAIRRVHMQVVYSQTFAALTT